MAHGNEKSTNTQRPSCKISLKMLWNEFVLRGGPPNMCLNCSNLGPGTFLNSGQWPQTWIFQYFCIVSGPGRWWLAIWYQLEQQTLASITNDGAGRGAKTKVDHQVHPKLCGPGFGFDIHYQNCELKILQWIPEKFSFWMCFFMWNHYFPFSFHQQLQQKYTQFWSWDFSPKNFHDSTKLGWESIQPLNTCWEKKIHRFSLHHDLDRWIPKGLPSRCLSRPRPPWSLRSPSPCHLPKWHQLYLRQLGSDMYR